MPLPALHKAGVMMNPSFRVFDPPTSTIKVYAVDKGRMREKDTIADDLKERPPPPVATRVFNTRSGRPRTGTSSSGRRTLKESCVLAESMMERSPFLMKNNPFPLHNSASRDLGIGGASHPEWTTTRAKSAKDLSAVDPVNLGRESPIRNMEGKDKGFAHKPTIRFSATGIPALEDQKWWQEPATIAGEQSTEAQMRLSDNDNYTFSYQRKTLFPNGLPSFSDSSISQVTQRRPRTAPEGGGINTPFTPSPTNALVRGKTVPLFAVRRASSPAPPLNFKIADPIRQSESSYMLARAKYY